MKGKNRHIKLEQVYDMENIRLADIEARKGKSSKYGPAKFDRNHEGNLLKLRLELMNRTYKTMSPEFEERFCDSKVRVLSKVHYKYHVAHHALMQVIMPVLEKSYYYESAASITGRGIHYAKKHIEKYVRTQPNKKFYHTLLDFVKFYHNVKRQKVYDRLCKEFTDEGIRWLLHDVIWVLGNHNGLKPDDGTRGMGIGLYPVQPIINFYLNDLDRKVAAIPEVKNYRYCDNILLISTSKKRLEEAIQLIVDYAANVLELPLHTDYGVQIFDLKHPINFVGYKIYPTHTFIRDSTKKKFKRKVKQTREDLRRLVLVSYKGWLEKCDGLTLWRKVTHLNSYNGFNTKPKKRFIVKQYKYDYIKNNKVLTWNYSRITNYLWLPKRELPTLSALTKFRNQLSKSLGNLLLCTDTMLPELNIPTQVENL